MHWIFLETVIALAYLARHLAREYSCLNVCAEMENGTAGDALFGAAAVLMMVLKLVPKRGRWQERLVGLPFGFLVLVFFFSGERFYLYHVCFFAPNCQTFKTLSSLFYIGFLVPIGITVYEISKFGGRRGGT